MTSRVRPQKLHKATRLLRCSHHNILKRIGKPEFSSAPGRRIDKMRLTFYNNCRGVDDDENIIFIHRALNFILLELTAAVHFGIGEPVAEQLLHLIF